MEGKEIWLIKHPRGLDLSKVEKLPISADASGEFDADLRHYQVFQDDLNDKTNLNARLSLLEKSKTHYKVRQNLNIKGFYSIQEKVQIPQIDYSKVTKQRKDVPKEKHLRLRHVPTGYGLKDFPQEEPSSKRSKKDKRDNVGGTPSKKAKKEKKEKRDKK